MLKFLTRAEPTGAEDVTSAETAEAFWRSLADEDPIEAQHAICDALAAIKGPRGPELDRPRGRWKDLFSAYEFASTHELTRQPVGTEFRDGRAVRSITLEQSLIRALLLQLTGDGRFLPLDIAVARQQVARWSDRLALTTVMGDGASDAPLIGFVVDPNGDFPLKRPSPLDNNQRGMRLDTTPIGQTIDADIAEARNAPVETGAEAMLRARRLALLTKLKNLLAAK